MTGAERHHRGVPRWLLVALSLTGCSPGVTALDVPDSADAFAVVTHDRVENTWYAQVEGGPPPVFPDIRDLDVFVFKSKFDLPQGDLPFVTSGRAEFPPPDQSYRLNDQDLQPQMPSPEFFAFRYEPTTPPCPPIGFVGLQGFESKLVSALTFDARILVFTLDGEALFVESGKSQVVVNTELGVVKGAARIANQVYMLIDNELIRADLEDDLNNRQPVVSDPIVSVFQGNNRVFALTESAILLEFDASGLKTQVSLPPVPSPDLQNMSLVDGAAGTWVGLNNALYRVNGPGLTEVTSFTSAVTALVIVRGDLVVFAGDIHRMVDGELQLLLTDDGPDVFVAVEWTNGFVAALRLGPMNTVSEVLSFDTDYARRCEFGRLGRTPDVTRFLGRFGENPIIAARGVLGNYGLLLLTER